jgi:hypothetical protein
MKIVLSLVKQIGGELHILPGDNGGGARVAVVSAGSYAGTVSTTGAADDKPDPATASQAAQKQ